MTRLHAPLRRLRLFTWRFHFTTSQVALVLLLLLAAIYSPSPCLVGAQIVEENGGGGGDVDPGFGVDSTDDDGTITAAGPVRQVEPYQVHVGDIVVEGTTFASAINSLDVRVPVPDGTTPEAFTIMVSACPCFAILCRDSCRIGRCIRPFRSNLSH